MKKLLSVTAVLIAAALFFAGCSNPSGSSSSTDPNNQNNQNNSGTQGQTVDSDSLPGTWKSDLNYWDADVYNDEVCGGTITEDGHGTAIYQNQNPTEPKPDNPIKENHFRSNIWKFVKDQNLTGFEATAKSTSPNCTYGFVWNWSEDDDKQNMYEITFEYNSFIIQKAINGEWDTVVSWTENTAIKLEPNENKVTIYKDGNKIVIKVNGTTIYTINNPELTKGMFGYRTAVGYEDIDENKGYTITYRLKRAQYEE